MASHTDSVLVAVDAALAAKQPDEAVRMLSAAAAAQDAPLAIFRRLGGLLFNLGRFDAGAAWLALAVQRYPDDWELWNALGVCYRRIGRPMDGLAALEKAQALASGSLAPVLNRLNIYTDLGDGEAAAPLAARLIAADPANGEYHRLAGVAHRNRGDQDAARAAFDAAIRLAPQSLQAWLDRADLAARLHRDGEALDVVERALERLPDAARLQEFKANLLRRLGRTADAEAFLVSLLEVAPSAWAHHQMGRLVADRDWGAARDHFRRAFELNPNDLALGYALAEHLDRPGRNDQGGGLDAAYELVVDLLRRGPPPNPPTLSFARHLCVKAGDYLRAASFGSFQQLGRAFARAGLHGPFLQHLSFVETPEDRVELVSQHRAWGALVEDVAARSPIVHPQPRQPDGRIRLGILSSDLRDHPVAYFTMPIFEHLDRSRFDVYCYSFFTGDRADATQQQIASTVTAFRWQRAMSDRDAAQMIADDRLDILFELGGATAMSRLAACAYKPAPIQASWLGYPHSAGLSTIDYLLTDPFVTPPREDLLIEKPLKMPSSWISLGVNAFRETDLIDPRTPEERNGFVTFGTANNPRKYGAEMIRVWARAAAAVPDARFLFVRPEASAACFRANLTALFAEEGVAPERVRFVANRGGHMRHYNEIDIALDTFPVTGGTTTCETLWMGVPVVSKVGAAFFERLSFSILTNAGLGDLAVDSDEAFVETARAVAADRDRRKALRSGLRDQLKASPLGQREVFARDFYDLLARTVKEHRARRRA